MPVIFPDQIKHEENNKLSAFILTSSYFALKVDKKRRFRLQATKISWPPTKFPDFLWPN